MKKELSQKIKIPEGVDVNIEGNMIKVKGPEGENEKKFEQGNLNIEKKGKEIMISNKQSTKKDKRMMNTLVAHIKNLIKGVQEQYEYRLKVCFNHFPITVEVSGETATIKNFLGEKIPRKVKIPKGAEVKVERDIIVVKSLNKEIAGQAAANFEKTTKISARDRRVFQDGIFLISKAGREI